MSEFNTSLLDFEDYIPNLKDVTECQKKWIAEAKQKLKCVDEEDLTADLFVQPTKSVLSTWLEGARDIMCRQQQLLQSYTDLVSTLKTDAISDKSKVIELQSKLLECKQEQLESLQTAVQTTVQDSVKTEMKSYGDVLKGTISTAAEFTPETLKKVVRTVIVEEDRNKNLLVFGLAEEETAEQAVTDLFLELDEKPRVEAVNRIGEKNSTAARPVKVTLSSTASVNTILARSSRLKKTVRYKSVYVCPDRSPKDRAVRKQLVEDLKKAMNDQPHQYHYIRGGKIHSRAKANT